MTVRWGITFGIVGGLLLLMVAGYAVQLFRVFEQCCPDCSVACFRDDGADFTWETKWYTVSHEGNRYGVTFHSKRFAKHFMRFLEERYGPWNTANILKIKREEEEYVVLNIFFHDHFTPWFYTQGPIKHDEEWIKTDFREICIHVQELLAQKSCCSICICRSNPEESHSQGAACVVQIPSDTYGEPGEGDPLHPEQTIKPPQSLPLSKDHSPSRGDKNGRRAMRPWTKASFRDFYMRASAASPSVPMCQRSPVGVLQSSTEHSTGGRDPFFGTNGSSSSDPSVSTPVVTGRGPQTSSGLIGPVVIHVIEASVDSFGNDKATQTMRQVRVS